jgi:hypothetical protein
VSATLVTRSTQSCFQLLLLLFPPRVLRLRPSVECIALSFNLLDVSVVLSLCLFERPFRLCYCLLATFP